MKRDGTKTAHNERTYTDDDGTIRVIYHDTEIVTIRPGGAVRLDTGGWLTTSTITHMRNALRRHGIPGNVSRAGGVFAYFDWTTERAYRVASRDENTVLLLPARCECGAPWDDASNGYRCASRVSS